MRFSHSHETSEQEWILVHTVNVSGPFFLSQAAIPHLIESGGNIVNVASKEARSVHGAILSVDNGMTAG